jgi:Fe-S-cluster containining protein
MRSPHEDLETTSAPVPCSATADGQTMPAAGDHREIPMRTASVAMRVGATRVELRFDVPTVPVESASLLPLLRSLTDTLVGIAAEETRARGLSISCRKGCGACCRQLVPISEMEVVALRRLVAALPEPRRSTVIERFERGIARLAEAGLMNTLRHPESVDSDEAELVGLDYFAQRVACPFLEDESCSIHAERPLACREYLVTSPAAHCTHPSSDSVQCVPVPAKLSRAVRRIHTEHEPPFEPWIPMILALDWPIADRPLQSATSMVTRAFARLTGAEIPDP